MLMEYHFTVFMSTKNILLMVHFMDHKLNCILRLWRYKIYTDIPRSLSYPYYKNRNMKYQTQSVIRDINILSMQFKT